MVRIQTLFLFALVIASLFCGVQAAHAVDDIDRILVVNGLSETLTLIDRAGDSIAQNVLALGLAPNRIRRAGTSVLVVNSISDDLWVIDPVTFSVTRTIKFPDGDNPWDVVVIDDTLCAVSMLVGSSAIFVNYATGDTLGRIATGKSPEGMAVVGDNLWIANTGFDFGTYQYDPGTITVADVHTGAPVTTVPVGTNPQSIVRAGDGMLHALCTGNYYDRFGIVYVIDPETATVLDSISLGGSPGDVIAGPGGVNFVAAGGWADSGHVYRYDALAGTVLNGAADPWHSAQGVVGLFERPEGGIYTLCFNADSVIGHASDGTVVEKYQVGDGPQAAVYITNRQPGDLDEDGFVTALDLGKLIDYLFAGAPPPPRPASADLNADCFCDALDLGTLIDYLFAGSADVQWGCLQ